MNSVFSFFPFTKIPDTLSLFWKSLLAIPIPALIDIIFVFSYGFVSGYFTNLIREHTNAIFQIIGTHGTEISKALLTQNNLLAVLHAQPGFSEQYSMLLKTLLLFAIAVFLLYLATQLFSWKYCFDILKKKKSATQYMQDFFFVNLVWGVLFFLLIFAEKTYLFFFYLTQRGQEPSSAIFYILYIVLFYFIFLSYTLLGDMPLKHVFQKTFSFGIRKAHIVLVTYGIIFLLFVATNFVLMNLYLVLPKISIVVGLLLLFPLISFSRIYLKNVVDSVLHDNASY